MISSKLSEMGVDFNSQNMLYNRQMLIYSILFFKVVILLTFNIQVFLIMELIIASPHITCRKIT